MVHRAEKFDDRRSHCLLGHIVQIADRNFLFVHAKSIRFEVFRSEALHHVVARDRLLQNLVQVGRLSCA